MERKPVCKTLKVVYENTKINLPSIDDCVFDTLGSPSYHISIQQDSNRIITVSSSADVEIYWLNAMLNHIEKLLMFFDGVFLPVEEYRFEDSETIDDKNLASYSCNMCAQRLSYFVSTNLFSYRRDKLIDFNSFITPEMFDKWERLIDELGPAHQMYLYCLADNKFTVDVRCAFLTELAEPLIEIVKEHTNFFSSLEPGARGTSLKNCLDALITKYGVDIFKRELSGKYDGVLNALVNSRVNIMHVKRKWKTPSLNGNECIVYVQKMSLLYRKVLFEMLGIQENIYAEQLNKCVSQIDRWNDVIDDFLRRI